MSTSGMNFDLELSTQALADFGHLRHEVGPWEVFLPVLTDHETPRS